MATMNVSLPLVLRDFVDEQVTAAGYGTSSEYLRELIRRDQERLALRKLMLDGVASPISGPADARFFEGLRQRIAARAGVAGKSKPKAARKPAAKRGSAKRS
jgi:antitoxin ParD1/3/4